MPIELIQISTQNLNEVVKTEQQGNITVNGYDVNTDSLKTNSLGNESQNVRDEFSDLTFLNQNWQITKNASDIIDIMGNTDGSSYLSIIKNYRTPDIKTEIISTKSFSLPARISIGTTASTRLNGTDFDVDFVSVDANKNIEILGDIIELFVESITIASNVWTVNCVDDIINKLFTNDIILLHSMDNTNLCVGPISITLSGRKSFTFTLTAANGTFTTAAGQIGTLGKVRRLDNLNRSINGFGFSLEGTSATNVRFTSKNRNASYSELRTDTALTNFSIATTNASFTNKPYTFGLKPQRIMEMNVNSKSISWNAFTDGSQSQSVFTLKKHMPLPDFDKKYVLRFSIDTFKNLSLIHKADIASITRTNGSTSVTVITKTPHNLKIGNQILTGGTTNTNFPLLTTAVAVATITNDTTFSYTQTVASTVTATGTNGSVFIFNGINSISPILALTFTNYQVTNNILTITSTANTTMSVGSHYQLFSTGNVEVDSRTWRCVEANLTITRLQPIDGSVMDVALTTTNFVSIIAVEYRIHLAQIQSYKRNIVEISNTWGNSRDADEALGVNVVSPITTVSTVSAVTNITNPVSISAFTSHGTYTTAITANTALTVLSTDLAATQIRNVVNGWLYSNMALIFNIEFSTDNLTWFTLENDVTSAAMSFPTYYYNGVTGTSPIRSLTITQSAASTTIMGHSLLRGMTVTVGAVTGNVLTGTTANTITFSNAAVTATSGNITVPANTVFRAQLTNIQTLGRYVRLRIINNTANASTWLYAGLSSINL